MRVRILVVSLLMLSGLPGCAAINPQPGYDEVRSSVEDRLGKQVHWKRGGAEDAKIRARVRELLQGELNVEQAVQVALLNNPGMQAMFEDIGVAQADLVQAGLLHNPVLDAVARSPRGGGADNLEFGLSFDFLQMLTLPLRKAVAERDYEATKLQVTGRILDLAVQVQEAFYQVQADSQAVEMLQQVVAAGDASVSARQRLRAAGNVTELDLDQERTLAYNARLRLAVAETSSMASRERLNVLMGVWGTATRWVAATRLPALPATPVDPSDIEKQAIASSLDLAMLRQRLDGLAHQAGLENIESVVPELEIGYSWEREAVSKDWLDGPQIKLQIPIFDMGQARRARVHGLIEKTVAEYRAKAIEVRSAVRLAVQMVGQSRARVELYEQTLLPLSQRVVYGSQLEFNAMQIGVFQLLIARQQQIIAAQRYIQDLRDYWQARARLDAILSGRLVAAGGGMGMDMTGGDMGAGSGGH